MSEHFCPVPWNHLSMTNNGDYRMCCDITEKPWGFLKDASGRNLNAKIDSISDIRNADVLKELRLTMLKGERHKLCSQCWLREDSGLDSRRQMFQSIYSDVEVNARNKTSVSGEISPEDFPIQNLDLRFGNKCNLSCRTCQPSDSSLKMQEWLSERSEKPKVLAYFDHKYSLAHDQPFAWNGQEQIFSDIQTNAGNLHQLYITGGEPMINEEHWQMLERLIANGDSQHIHLVYNSNVLMIPQKSEKIWREFKTVDISCSLDGVGRYAEYIRPPTVWEKVEGNLRMLEAMPDSIRFAISPTISVLNIHHIPAMMEWLSDSGLKKPSLQIGTHLLFNPDFFSIQVLPNEAKAEVHNLLGEDSHFVGVLRHMDAKDQSHRLPELLRVLGDFRQNLPELANAILK